MTATEIYREFVQRNGSETPWSRADGKRPYVNRGIWFDPDAVKTDGKGNIDERPLLRGKPCFGRPEIWLRQFLFYDVKRINKEPYPFKKSRCYECALEDSCYKVCDERLGCDPLIEKAVGRLILLAEQSKAPLFETPGHRVAWQSFLEAVIRHGPWQDVNDLRVVAEQVRLAEKRKSDKKETAKRFRQDQRARLKGHHARHARSITPELLQELDGERKKRLDILLRLRSWSGADPRIRQMTVKECERTADVWWSKKWHEYHGLKPTGKAIAEHLIASGRAPGARLSSLTTAVCRVLKRVAFLEDDNGHQPIWDPFTPTP